MKYLFLILGILLGTVAGLPWWVYLLGMAAIAAGVTLYEGLK